MAKKEVLPGSAQSFRNSYFGRLAGLTVENQDGEPLGRLHDCLLDMHTGEVEASIISGGGILGLGRQARLVPKQCLTSATAKKGVLGLNLSREKWSQTPVLQSTSLASVEKAFTTGELPTKGERRLAAAAANTKPALTPTGPFNSPGHGRNSQVLQLASDLIGKPVVNRQQNSLGKVSDLILDVSARKPAFALVSSKRGLWHHRETFAVPLRALSLSAAGELVIDAARTQLAGAPAFSDQAWVAASPQSAPVVFRIPPLKKTGRAAVHRPFAATNFRNSERNKSMSGHVS